MSVQPPTPAGQLLTYSMVSLFATALTVGVGYCWWTSANTVPVMQGFRDMTAANKWKNKKAMNAQKQGSVNLMKERGSMNPMRRQNGSANVMKRGSTNPMRRRMAPMPTTARVEGFAGPTKGTGVPDCLQTCKECAELYEMISMRAVTTDDGPGDLRELQLILSKLACFKRDLLGIAKVVQATRYQPFSSSHDLEPVAETTARCFSKTIPQRDLSLSLDKWGSRGTFLVKRLCTAQNMSDAEEREALRLFGDAMADVTNIALGECCSSADAVIGGVAAPRMVTGFTPSTTQALQSYKGYY